MLTVYGALMPLRLLEEIRFWKTREKEHTVVIRELAPNLEPEYVQVLKEWESLFSNTELEAGRWIEAVIRSPSGITPYIQMQIEGLLHMSVEQTKAFVNQLSYMLSNSGAASASSILCVVIQRIIRESEYFLGVLQAFMAGASPYRNPSIQSHPSQSEGTFDAASASASSFISNSNTAEFGGGSPLGQAFASVTFFPLKQNQRNLKEDQPEPKAAKADFSELRSAIPEEERPAGEENPHTATGEGTWSGSTLTVTSPVPIGGHKLPPLPYAYEALEPHIDAETMKLHHDKHHQSYVDGLNLAEKKLAEARKSGDYALVKHWEREAAFHGAGHYLHTIFWNIMAPRAGGKPTGPVSPQMNKDFGSFEAFQNHFSEAADKVEGGGWALLIWSPRSHRLEILQAEKHQNLSQWDVIPILVLDVWEHAYYLKHQNKRPAYIEAWWNVVNWKHVNDRFAAARNLKWEPY